MLQGKLDQYECCSLKCVNVDVAMQSLSAWILQGKLYPCGLCSSNYVSVDCKMCYREY